MGEALDSLNGYFEENPEFLLGMLDISLDDLDEMTEELDLENYFFIAVLEDFHLLFHPKTPPVESMLCPLAEPGEANPTQLKNRCYPTHYCVLRVCEESPTMDAAVANSSLMNKIRTCKKGAGSPDAR
eukprot:jgi/Psemu1/70735/estExt_Genemark1.C_43640001